MEHCSKCKISKLRSEFYKDNNRKRGLSYWCKLCIKKWQKENKGLLYFNTRKNYDKKRKFYISYKKNLKCQRCGENHLACLEFHHRDPEEKDFEIGHAISGHGIKLIMNEIAKCDILCTNCHRKLHYDLKKK